MRYAKEHGKWITFDPNLRKPLWKNPDDARAAILWGLHQADFVKISDDEVEFLLGCDEKEAGNLLLTEFGVKLALITMGPRGAYLVNRNANAYAESPKVSPVDTTGAGDICGGSAVSQILRLGKPMEALNAEELSRIVRFASTAASLSTEKPGGIPSIAEYETVVGRM